jgi:sulfite exporter TauE/SafE
MGFLSAFTIGILGSLHCVGMCGPIVLALPLTSTEKNKVILQSLLYHFGRICTYTLMGMFMGLMGWGIALAGYQKLFSISLGVLIIISALFTFSLEQKLFNNRVIQRFFNWVKIKLGGLLSIRDTSSAFKIGLLNGILPCGLVYIALAGAVATGGIFNGGMYMMSFGLGTMPLLVAVMILGKMHKLKIMRLRRWIPLALVLFGLLLIYRGVMLDVPLDLRLWESNNFPIMCH